MRSTPEERLRAIDASRPALDVSLRTAAIRS
jgi:hypothetical protein